ncbi:unnamed protein product, partial [Brenthis ino]
MGHMEVFPERICPSISTTALELRYTSCGLVLPAFQHLISSCCTRLPKSKCKCISTFNHRLFNRNIRITPMVVSLVRTFPSIFPTATSSQLYSWCLYPLVCLLHSSSLVTSFLRSKLFHLL